MEVNCRACSATCVDYKHLLDEAVIEEERTTLAALLSYCTSLEIACDGGDDDMLPDHICSSCVEQLIQAYLFKEMVLNTDKELRERTLYEEAPSADPQEIIEEDGAADGALLPADLDESNDCAKSPLGRGETVEEERHTDEEAYEMEEWLEIDEVQTDAERGSERSEELESRKFGGKISSEVTAEDMSKMDDPNGDKLAAAAENEESDDVEELLVDAEDANALGECKSGKRGVYKSRKKKDGDTADAEFVCKFCGKSFSQMCRLRVHTFLHTGEKPHECELCGKRSRTRTAHNQHMLTHSEQKRYKCPTCGQHYRTSTSLRVHQRKHTGERPFHCPVCEKSFPTMEQKRLHVMLHTGERPYSCDVCGKAYRENSSLRQHMLTHGDQKPFQCEICGKGLTQMSGYKRHMLMHTGELPHKCDVCGRAFRISSNLVAHKRLHLAIKPFQCSQCNKGFPTSTRLKRHEAQHARKAEPKVNTFQPRKSKVKPQLYEQKMAKSRVVEIL